MSEPQLPPGERVAGSDQPIVLREPAASVSQPASWTLFGLLLCSGVFAVGYRLLMHSQLGQGAALFIGLPIILGAVVALATAPRSSLGMALKVTALCLCVVAPLLGEGAICVAMAAPLIFGVVALTVLLIRALSRGAGRGKVSCCALLVGLSPLLWEPAAKQPGWQDHRPCGVLSRPGAVVAAVVSAPRGCGAEPALQSGV